MRMLLPSRSWAATTVRSQRIRTLALTGAAVLLIVGSLAAWNASPVREGSTAPAAAPPEQAPSVVPSASASHPASEASYAASLPFEGWERLAGRSPSPVVRTGAAFAYDAATGYSILFGGCGAHVCPLRDTWKLQDGTWTNLTPSLSTVPPARSGATLVDDVHDGYLLLFGGQGPTGPLGDAWRFSDGAWSPIAPLSGVVPPARTNATSSYDAADGVVVLFGGIGSGSAVLGDTWTYSGGAWTALGGPGFTAPSPRSSAGMAFDASDAYTVLFGGESAAHAPLGDTWTFSAGRWTNLTGTVGLGPSARFGASVASDPERGGLILYGGENSSPLADTWTFGARAWTNLGINLSASPLAREGASATFDGALNYVALFGGTTGSAYRLGLWALLSPLTAQVIPTSASIAPGSSDQFQAAVVGGLPPYNESWTFGDGSPAVAGPTAGHTFQVAGNYGVTVTAVDSLGATVATTLNLTVALPPLAVTLKVGPTAPTVGETITLTANASGGLPPYQYHWAGATSNCSTSVAAVLTCPEMLSGTFGYSVAVTDSRGAAASTGTNLTIQAVSGSTSNGPIASAGHSSMSSVTGLTALAAALAITLACGVAVVTYRAGRRREAAQMEQRPLCYAVPAWSETPKEYHPGDPEPELQLAGPWDRP
jgi:hypothetical protein